MTSPGGSVRKPPALRFGAVAILHAVASGSRFGFDVMATTGLTSGTVYPALDRLEDLGYLTSEWEDAGIAHREGRPPRRYFTLTRPGAEALAEALKRYKMLKPVPLAALGGKTTRG
jgi:DNA-binding PadR family transcriptional regulator